MKCECDYKECTGNYGFDSVTGMLLVCSDSKMPGEAGVYIGIDGAVKLSRMLQEFVLRKMRVEVEP